MHLSLLWDKDPTTLTDEEIKAIAEDQTQRYHDLALAQKKNPKAAKTAAAENLTLDDLLG